VSACTEPWLRRARRLVVPCAGALAGTAAVAMWPEAFLFILLGLPFALAAGVPGYLLRRRWSDAACMALPVLACSWLEPGTGAALMAALALTCLALTRRPLFSAALAATPLLLFVLGLHLKMQFAGTRLTWHDLRFFFQAFADNLGVMASQPTLLLYAAAALLVLVALLAVTWVWDQRSRPAAAPRTPWLAMALSLTLATGAASSVASEIVQLRGLRDWVWSDPAGSTVQPFSRFISTALMVPAWQEPSADTTQLALNAKRHAAASRDTRRADIVVFLQESQFNPEALADCPPALCRLPVFYPDAQTRAYGPLRVHTYGGATWLSEFALATAVPHTAFGEGAAFAPFNVAPGVRRSFVRSLRDAGYHTVAVYPVRSGMMNARRAYEAYGYEKFLDAPEVGLSGDYFTSDADVHSAALRVLEQERAQGKPVLLMVVTIFNHAEHGVKMERVPAGLVEQFKPHFPNGREAENVADYVWRTGEFQRAMDQTRKAVFRGGRPAVVAWFGDHQPAFAGAVALRDRMQTLQQGASHFPARFQTWYHVSSNFGARSPRLAAAPLDIAFLPGLLAETAGAPLDDLLAANAVAREGCGGLLRECRAPQLRDAYLTHYWSDLKAIELP